MAAFGRIEPFDNRSYRDIFIPWATEPSVGAVWGDTLTVAPAIAPRLAEFESFINDRMVAVAGN